MASSKRRSSRSSSTRSGARRNATDRYDQAVADAIGINRTDMRCLDVIQREGPVPAGRLADETGLTTGAITTVLDRLERAGFARRTRDPADRRRVLVELGAGRAGRSQRATTVSAWPTAERLFPALRRRAAGAPARVSPARAASSTGDEAAKLEARMRGEPGGGA